MGAGLENNFYEPSVRSSFLEGASYKKTPVSSQKETNPAGNGANALNKKTNETALGRLSTETSSNKALKSSNWKIALSLLSCDEKTYAKIVEQRARHEEEKTRKAHEEAHMKQKANQIKDSLTANVSLPLNNSIV